VNLNKIQQGVDVTKPGTNQNPVPRTSAVPITQEAAPAPQSGTPARPNAPRQNTPAKPSGSQVEQR